MGKYELRSHETDLQQYKIICEMSLRFSIFVSSERTCIISASCYTKYCAWGVQYMVLPVALTH